MTPRRLSDAQCARLRADHAAGMSFVGLGKKYGVSTSTARNMVFPRKDQHAAGQPGPPIRPGSLFVSKKLRGRIVALINHKLVGQRYLDALEFACHGERRDHELVQFGIRLETLPDIDPRIVEARHTLHRVSDVIRERICADRATGMTFRALGEKHGVPTNTAYSIAHLVEVVTPQSKETKTHHEGNSTTMTTRLADSLELVKECEDAGWPVNKVTDGYRVSLPNGKFQGIHLSYSDRRSLQYARRGLVNAGLIEAKEEAARQREADRQARLAADRATAEQRAKALAVATAAKTGRQKAALLKAAGPYLGEPEEVHISWFAEKHPAPWMRWVWITPAIARYLLDHHNVPGKAGAPGTNRPQTEARIRDYRDIYVSGQWKLTHQGMAMDWNAMLQDGQHRLAGFLLAAELIEGLRVPVAFFVGMDPDNFKAIDEVLLRNANQLFTMTGEKNGATLKAAIRLVIAHSNGDENARNRWRLRNTNAQILDTFTRNPEMLKAAAAAANSRPKMRDDRQPLMMNNGAYAALHYLLYAANGEGNRFVDAFLYGAVRGTRVGSRTLLDDDDPRSALRRALAAIKKEQKGRSAQAMDQLGLGILAWNQLVTGRHRQRLTWSKDSEIPQVLICKDDGGSVPPRALAGEIDSAVEEDADE